MVPFVFPSPQDDPAVILEDADFLVIRKPCGMHTSLSPKEASEKPVKNLLSWVWERYPETAAVSGRERGEGGLLHRLDRDTSGLVLFARNEDAFEALVSAAEAGFFQKEYVLHATPSFSGLAGCRPEHSSPTGIEAWQWDAAWNGEGGGPGITDRLAAILSDTLAAGRSAAVESLFRAYGPGAARVVCAVSGADLGKKKDEWSRVLYRTEILEARPVESQGFESVLQLRVGLTRGFRHQIRAHMAWVGLPLLGDARYGEGTAPRLCLHAAVLEFPHPQSGEIVRIEG
jgi:23S rRNA pseudouridine1911/1915/1917 synthase